MALTAEMPRPRTVQESLTRIPRNGLGFHGTSSYRADKIRFEGFDPQLTSERTTWLLHGTKQIHYFHIRPKNPMQVEALQEIFKTASARAHIAVGEDAKIGIDSSPVLLVFQSPPAMGIKGVTIIPAEKTEVYPHERTSTKLFRPLIMGTVPLQYRINEVQEAIEKWYEAADLINSKIFKAVV